MPVGTFPLEASVVELEEDHFRYAAVRVTFSGEPPVRFIEALTGHEDLKSFNKGEQALFGFGVDAGLGTVVDEAARDAYCDFAQQWHKENPDGNIYDDYFMKEFSKSP